MTSRSHDSAGLIPTKWRPLSRRSGAEKSGLNILFFKYGISTTANSSQYLLKNNKATNVGVKILWHGFPLMKLKLIG
jgi:CxxC motif-containing protein (DUF1111 family)